MGSCQSGHFRSRDPGSNPVICNFIEILSTVDWKKKRPAAIVNLKSDFNIGRCKLVSVRPHLCSTQHYQHLFEETLITSKWRNFKKCFLIKKWAILGLFFIIFVFSNKHYNFLQQINVKKVHPVYGAGIWTHDLREMSLLS